MDPDDLTDEAISKDLKRLIDACRPHISKDGADLARHYVDHDEAEMAFEAVFLDLMEARHLPASLDREKWTAIGEHLHLDEESVLDSRFWTKFENFLAGRG